MNTRFHSFRTLVTVLLAGALTACATTTDPFTGEPRPARTGTDRKSVV